MNKIKIKASGITNLTDARYFAAKEVEWLGYCLDPASPQYIAPQAMLAIREWVGGVYTVGEFGYISGEELQNAAAEYQLDAVQVGVFATEDDLIPLHGRVQILREIVVEPDADAAALLQEIRGMAHLADVSILTFRANGLSWNDLKAGRPFDPETLRALCAAAPVLINIELDAGAVVELLEAVSPYGLSVQGGAEEKTGFKSFDDLDEVFEVLEKE